MRRLSRSISTILLFLAGCGGGSSQLVPTGKTSSATIGTTGGNLASTDGALQVVIPAGALPSNVMVSVTPTTPPGSGSIGTVYEIGPTGTQFTTPITLTLQYDASKLGGTDPSMLRVATYASGGWQMLPGAKIDTQAKTVSGTTTHLSPYTLVSAATGAVCATIRGGANCSGSTGSDGTPNGGSVSCTASTCASAANACAGYPGAKLSGCTDSADGFTATCCFDPGASICFSAGAGGACLDAAGGPAGTGTGGSQTFTCPPPPTCATATAANTCGGYPGATVQDCADTASGYSAACCFAPGAPVCVAVGAGAGCADGGNTNGPSGQTFTCPPPPTCKGSNPCANTPGTTMTSCTDTTNGYNAVCCYPVGQLPATGGSGSSSGTPGADAGMSSGGGGTSGTDTGGGKDAGVVYPPPPPPDGGHMLPPDKDAGGYVPPPPPDGGFLPPPDKDAGGYVPPPPPDGGFPPPPDKDAGGYVPPPPPPTDAGTQPCQPMMMPPSTAGAPCGAGEFCPATGTSWQVRCQQGGICSCMQDGKQLAMVNASCDPYDWAALMQACGFPTQ
jgi:hypothetical protein